RSGGSVPDGQEYGGEDGRDREIGELEEPVLAGRVEAVPAYVPAAGRRSESAGRRRGRGQRPHGPADEQEQPEKADQGGADGGQGPTQIGADRNGQREGEHRFGGRSEVDREEPDPA